MDQITEQVDQVKEFVNTFDLTQYVDKRIVYGLAMYQMGRMAHEAFWKPTYGFYKHYLRPRIDIIKGFEGADWVVITGSSDGIGEALCHQFAKSGLNIVMISRTQSKLEKVAKDVMDQHKVKTLIIQYDFTNLRTSDDAQQFKELIIARTKGLDIGIVVNNVGMGAWGTLHQVIFEKVFNSFSVNIATQTVLTHIFASKWQEERQGKKCLIIDYSSTLGEKPNGAALYSAQKTYNQTFSRAAEISYKEWYEKDPQGNPNIQFMQVYPNSVKSAMNPGYFCFSVTSEEHAKAVVDQIGYSTSNRGALMHEQCNYLRKYWLINQLVTMENARRIANLQKAREANKDK